MMVIFTFSFSSSSSIKNNTIPRFHVTTKHLVGILFLLLLELSGASNESSSSTATRRTTNRNRDSSNPEWEYYRRQQRQQQKQLAHSTTLLRSSSQTVPKFYSPSMKLLVQKGDRILLPCVVEDLGEDHILWRHATNILAGSNISTYSEDSGRIRLFQNFTLEISNVSADDEGEYECLLASTSWSSLKLTHTVAVQDPPTVTVLPAKGSITVSEGETVQIGCLPQGKPKPKITWTKRDGPLPRNNQKLLNESIITMERVSRHHTGLYVCHAENGVGLPGIGAIYIRVFHTPELEIPKRRVHGGLGYKIQLLCICNADPQPTIQWYLGQNAVQLSDRVYMDSRWKEHSLTITSVRESDFGMYMVSCNNSLGFDLKYIELTGVPNPPVVSRWESSTVSEQQAAFGLPRREEKEEQDEEETSQEPRHDDDHHRNSDDNKTRNFLDSSSTDAGGGGGGAVVVQVQLYWAVECYSRLIDYRLAFRPAPAKPLTSHDEDKKVQVWTELSIPADHSSTFLHSKSYVLRGLQRDTIYEAVIKARNRYGWSPISSLCLFATFPNSSSNDAPAIKEFLAELDNMGDDDDTTVLGTKRRYLHPYLEGPLGLGRHRNGSWNGTTNAASISTSTAAPNLCHHHHGPRISIISIILSIIIFI